MKPGDKIILVEIFYVVFGTLTCIFFCVYFGKENSDFVFKIIQLLLTFLGGFGIGRSFNR
jgi:hypothetical protein